MTTKTSKPRWRIIQGPSPVGTPCFRVEKRFLWWRSLQAYGYDLYSARVRLGALRHPVVVRSETALIEVSDDGVWTDRA